MGKRTKARVKVDVVAPKEENRWGLYIFVDDGLRQVFRDLQVRPWCRDIEHYKPSYFLFHRDAADPDPRFKEIDHADYIEPLCGLKMHTSHRR